MPEMWKDLDPSSPRFNWTYLALPAEVRVREPHSTSRHFVIERGAPDGTPRVVAPWGEFQQADGETIGALLNRAAIGLPAAWHQVEPVLVLCGAEVPA